MLYRRLLRPSIIGLSGAAIVGFVASCNWDPTKRPQHDVLVVYPRQPYEDWAKAIRLYLKDRFDLDVLIRELSPNDPEEECLVSVLTTPATAILPMQVELTKLLAEHHPKNALLCSKDPGTYDKLDDKSRVGSLILSNRVSHIPTLNVQTATASSIKCFLERDCSQSDRFICKPVRGAGSQHQRIMTREDLKTLIRLVENKMWKDKPVIVQPYFEDHTTLEFNFFARDGQLVSWLCTSSPPGGLSESDWEKGVTLSRFRDASGELEKRMKDFVHRLVSTYELSGLMEVEFLLDASSGQIYFLEVNPRISSSVVAFDEDGISPYIEELVVPYLRHLGALESKCPESKRSKHDDFFFPPELEATRTLQKFLREREIDAQESPGRVPYS